MVSKLDSPAVVLILGGTTSVARALATYLLEGDEPKAQFVRLADRFSVHPPTTYIDRPFSELLNAESSNLEYKQVNLGNVQNHADLFTPPAKWGSVEETGWKRFDLMFDLTGEMGFDKPELIQVSNTYQVALALASSAAKLPDEQKPLGYVRLQQPYYEMKSLSSSSQGHTETDVLKPDGIRGRWWHETLRSIGKVAQEDGLNFGVVRCAAWYGPGAWDSEVVPRLVVGHVYKFLNEKMEFLYNSDLRINTVHAIDVAQALYLTGTYLATTPRSQCLEQAGVNLMFPWNPPSSSPFKLGALKRSGSFTDVWKSVKTVAPESVKVRVPLFNVTDDADSTQDSLARAVASVWGVKYGFLGGAVTSLVQQFAKTDFNEMVEDVNEMLLHADSTLHYTALQQHIEAWSRMLAESHPPIMSTSLSPFLDAHAFRKMAICLDGSKARKILGYSPAKPTVEVEELRSIAKGFQEDGIWPTL